jgi:hypothetical protein
MKLTKLSLAAVMALGFASSATADVDVKVTGGQAVLYYNSLSAGDTDLFDKAKAKGNIGLQLKSTADLKNGYTAGVTLNMISTAGLEGNLVSGVMQSTDEGLNGGYWIPEAYVAKTVGNTTLKIGRQYLNTPLAFSEGWNVFKNSFEAVVVANKDLPKTTVVLAMVNKANTNGLGKEMDDFNLINNGNAGEDSAVYALGAMNKSIPNLNINAWGYVAPSYFNALWLDATYKLNVGLPLTLAAQTATISPDDGDTTTMFGAKVATKVAGFTLIGAFDSVSDGKIAVENRGTGVKTKLFVQQILNQGSIKKDATTVQLKAVTPSYMGAKLIAQYAMTSDNSTNADDLNELDLIVKTKVLSTNILVAYVNQSFDDSSKDQDVFRVVARYKF